MWADIKMEQISATEYLIKKQSQENKQKWPYQ